MNIHLIAIGGSAMHNLAIALKNKNHNITGSDDAIFEPSKGRLKKNGLLPEKNGWFAEKITTKIDAIILGMHARIDNPELIRAQELNIPIFSYPEYIYKQSIDKKRVVIGGSHGKTTITSMIIHVLKNEGLDFDYMVGAKIEGFQTMVKLTNAPIIILEGDEYLSSAIDRRPKFHLYKPHIGVISGISWDHINVFPTFENYINQFRIFKNMIKETLIYCSLDFELNKLMEERNTCNTIPYKTPIHTIKNGATIVNGTKLSFFGEHNLQNMNAAKLVCNELGITNNKFYHAISSFIGASNRLELIKETEEYAFYKDFAHSPSKLKATIDSMKNQFPQRKLIACMELHTFSSLNNKFINQYKDCMSKADIAIIYFDPNNITNKKLNQITKNEIQNAFNSKDLLVYTDSEMLLNKLKSICQSQFINVRFVFRAHSFGHFTPPSISLG